MELALKYLLAYLVFASIFLAWLGYTSSKEAWWISVLWLWIIGCVGFTAIWAVQTWA